MTGRPRIADERMAAQGQLRHDRMAGVDDMTDREASVPHGTMQAMRWRTREEAWQAVLNGDPRVPVLPALPRTDLLGQPMFWCGHYEIERLLDAMITDPDHAS